MRRTLAFGVLAGFVAAASPLGAQPAITGPVDPTTFSQLKDFKAHRSSSNSRYPDWNDDSAHLYPGETLTIGATNIFNTHPEKIAMSSSNPIYALTNSTADGQVYPRSGGPFGINGGLWYARVRFKF